LFNNDENLGYGENSFRAAARCSGDWIAFCDQDDVWLPNRLRDAGEAIARHPDVWLVLQNAYLCAEDLSRSGAMFPDHFRSGVYGPFSQPGFWVWAGFTQTVRAAMFRDFDTKHRPPSYSVKGQPVVHDTWTCLIANAIGGFVVLPEPTALYRRHSASLSGPHAQRSAAALIGDSLPVGEGYYLFRASSAHGTASYFGRLAGSSIDLHAAAFRRSERRFSILANVYERRAALYSAASIPGRIWHFLLILAKGGYIGPGIIALGWKSGAKDLAHALGLFGLLRKLIR
jgi:hypothetical protein